MSSTSFDLVAIQTDATLYAAAFRELIGLGSLATQSITFGTGVATAMAVNVGSAGALVVNGGALGTPSGGVATNLTGTASGLTAGNVTTNANLTGHVTSVGNAALLGSFTKAQLDAAVSDGSVLYVGDAPTSHNHAASAITSGTVDPARLGSGSSITTKYLRGDSTWQPITGGGDALVSGTLDQFADVTQTVGQTLAITSSTTLAGGSHSGTNTGDQDLSSYQPLDADLTALAALAGTNTIYYRSAANTWSAVTIGTNLTFTGGTLAATAGGGTPTAITVADTTDTTCFVGLFESATGDLGPKTDAGITYNASTGVLTATGFAGPLTGDVTGNASGSSGSCTGNAATVTTNANLTGHVTSTGNAAILGSFTKAQLDTAVSDGNVLYVGDSLGVATATTINKVTLTAPATGSTLTIIDGKTFTANNTLTLSGTDGSTLNVGTGGTLGTAAYTASSAYAAAIHSHTYSATDLTTGTLPPARLSLTKSELDTAVSDGNVVYVGDSLGSNIYTALRTTEVTSTPSGTTQTIDLTAGNLQTLTLTSATGTVAVTLTPPTSSAAGSIVINQHASAAKGMTWATTGGTTKWSGTQPGAGDAVSSQRIVAWRWHSASSTMFLTSPDVFT